MTSSGPAHLLHGAVPHLEAAGGGHIVNISSRGAFRGEYCARTRQWDIFGPLWHGGQGVKALTLAGAITIAAIFEASVFHAIVTSLHEAMGFDVVTLRLCDWERRELSRPVVATAVDGSPEAVWEGQTGHLVPPGDPAAAASSR